jgi:hypothetical protein
MMHPATIPANIDWIIQRWPHILELRLKGTPRPWKTPDLTPEQWAEMDRRAREEKQERGAFTLGESPAPVHLDMLDTQLDIARRVQELALTMSGQLQHNLRRHKHPDPVPHLHYLKGHLHKIDNELHNRIRRETAAIRHAMATLFTEVFDGQRLKTDCPWCKLPKLYIRMIGPEDNPQPIVACESGTCEPPEADCGKYWRGNPAWPFYEWEWLAQQINHEESKTA